MHIKLLWNWIMPQRKLDDWITSYLQYVDNTEPPHLYKVWAAVSAIAACLKRKCYLRWDKRVYPNHYIALVGPSGTRKNTALDPIEDLLLGVGIYVASDAVTRQALIQEINECSAFDKDPVTDKVMPHASLTVFSKEFTVFLGWKNQELIMDLTDWYDCKNLWRYRTKHMGTDTIVGVYVNMIGGTTPDTLHMALPEESIGGGLTARIIFVYELKKGKVVADPYAIPKDIEQLESDLANDLAAIHTMCGQFRFTPNALDRIMSFYIAQEENPPFKDERFLDGYVGRRLTHLLKTTMVMCASRSDDMIIDTYDFERALALLTQTERNMPNTFRGIGKSKSAELLPRIEGVIASSGEVKFSKLMMLFRADINQRELMEIIAVLEKMKFCSYTPIEGDAVITFLGERLDEIKELEEE